MKRLVICAFVSFILVLPSLFGQTNAPARDQLQQLVAQLQQSPGDQALREKIIALALTLNPKPATPDAVTMAEGAAEYAFKNAKSNSDFSDAAKQYERALLLAPWLAVDYFNCGVTHEKAGENKEAILSFNLYLLAAPNSDDALAVKKRIGGLQYAAQKAEEEANSTDSKWRKLLKSLDGIKWRHDVNENGQVWYSEITCSGNSLARKDFIISSRGTNLAGKTFDAWKATFENSTFIFSSQDDQFYHGQGVISNDTKTITIHSVVTNNAAIRDFTWVYTRE
jgi:tetratricopeptide (TPR) repeat protein